MPPFKVKADHNIDLHANGVRNYGQDTSNGTSETGDGGIVFIQDDNKDGEKDKGKPTIIDAATFDKLDKSNSKTTESAIVDDAKSKNFVLSNDVSVGQRSPLSQIVDTDPDGLQKPSIVIDGVDSTGRGEPKDAIKLD